MNIRRITTLLLAALVVGAAACVPRIEEPEVRLAGVRLGGLGLQGGLVYVRLSVVNPNRFGLKAAGLTYDLDLADIQDGERRWVDLAEGTFAEKIRVEGNDSTVVEIPVEFRYSGLGSAVRSILATGTFDYRVRGEVSITEPLGTEIPYRHSGTVTLTN